MTKTCKSKFAKRLSNRMTPENLKKIIARLESLVEKQGAK